MRDDDGFASAERAIEDQILEWQAMAHGASVALKMMQDSRSMVEPEAPIVEPVEIPPSAPREVVPDHALFEGSGEPMPVGDESDSETVSFDEPGRTHPLDPMATDGLVGDPPIADLELAAAQALTEGVEVAVDDRIWIQDGMQPAYGDRPHPFENLVKDS